MILLANMTLDIALLGSEVVELPRTAVLRQWRALVQVFVPHGTILAWRDHALSGLGVEVRSLRQTRTSIVTREISVVNFAFVHTFFGSKVIGLPFLARLC